jgi:hypothetical protein
VGAVSGSLVFFSDFFDLDLGDSLVLSVADSLFGAFSVLASVFFVVLLVASSVLFFSFVLVFGEELVEASDGALFSAAGLLVFVGGADVTGVAAGVAFGLMLLAGVAVAAAEAVAAGVALAATLALGAADAVAPGAAVALVDAAVVLVVPVVVVPDVEVTPTLKLGVTP